MRNCFDLELIAPLSNNILIWLWGTCLLVLSYILIWLMKKYKCNWFSGQISSNLEYVDLKNIRRYCHGNPSSTTVRDQVFLQHRAMITVSNPPSTSKLYDNWSQFPQMLESFMSHDNISPCVMHCILQSKQSK